MARVSAREENRERVGARKYLGEREGAASWRSYPPRTAKRRAEGMAASWRGSSSSARGRYRKKMKTVLQKTPCSFLNSSVFCSLLKPVAFRDLIEAIKLSQKL